MKIVKLMAENVKKLKAIVIDSAALNMLKITGANEQGKTTVLDCIWWALGGAKDIQDKPIREGQKTAKITVDLGDLLVTRKFTASGSTLEVANKDGATYKSPQAILDKLIGDLSFDPLKFAKAKKDDKVSMMLKVVDLKVDHEKLKTICGCEIEKLDNPLQCVNSAYKKIFDQRAIVNRDLDKSKKALEQFAGVEKIESVITLDLIKERDYKLEINRKNQKERELVTMYERDVQPVRNSLTLENTNVADLEIKLKAAKERVVELTKTISAKTNIINQQKIKIAALVDEDLTDISLKITNADDQNKKAQQWIDKVKTVDELSVHEVSSNSFTSILDSIKAYKEELVKSVKFPVEGLNFADGGVTLNNIPIEQSSSAQQLKVSVAIAMALNPKLKVIRIDDGSLLDSKSMAILEEMAKDNDYQVWVEMVNETGNVGLFIEDGEIVNDNYKKESELQTL